MKDQMPHRKMPLFIQLTHAGPPNTGLRKLNSEGLGRCKSKILHSLEAFTRLKVRLATAEQDCL